MSKDILDAADEHFFRSGMKFEYGRPDSQTTTKSDAGVTDRSRTEQDLDGDGYRGVDCSSFVWRGMKNAGYDVGDQPFSTHALYNGNHTTAYAQKHFDVMSKADTAKDLEPGDILMLKSVKGSNQHVAIFKGYDANGNIQFVGSQTSTGPAEVTMTPGTYWATNMEIVGALRAKPEFRTHEPVHGQGTAPSGQHAPSAPHAKTEAHHAGAKPAAVHPDTLRKGDENAKVTALQESLTRLGYKGDNGRALEPDGRFGDQTKAAVERFQRDHNLTPDGVVGGKTRDAIDKQIQSGPHLSSPANPYHAMFRQARDGVFRIDAEHGRTPDIQSHQLAGSVTADAVKGGFKSIDHVMLSPDASRTYAVQGDLNSPFKQIAEVNTTQGMATPLEKSSEAVQQHAAQQAQRQPSQQQTQQQPVSPAGL
ncbi:MAG: XVIPCD domain-containing protein [Luteibacter sp.]